MNIMEGYPETRYQVFTAAGITLKDIESDETKWNECYCESDEN